MSAITHLKPVSSASKRDDRPAYPVDELLRWTVRDELPKRRDERHDGPRSGGITPMWRHGVLGTRIDCWSREPGMPVAAGEPHPDALVIEGAVAELGAAIKVADEGRGPIPLDLTAYQIDAGLGSDCQLAKVSARAIMGAIPWLITTAKRGRAPDFGDGVELAPVLGSRGRVTIWRTVEEVFGEDRDGRPLIVRTDRAIEVARGGTYSAGSFCKIRWQRTPSDVASDRATYASWHCALTWLADRLAGVGETGQPLLTSRRPKAPTAPMSPWIKPAVQPRVLYAVDGEADDTTSPVKAGRKALRAETGTSLHHRDCPPRQMAA